MIPFILNLVISIISCSAIIFRFKDIVLRTGLIISVVCASLISFGLITLYAGKPIVKNLPDDIIVYGHAINLEDKRIYIMYKETNGDWPPSLIDMRYSKELKEALKSGVKINKGKPFRMKESEEGTQGGEGEGKEGDGKGEGENQGSMSNESSTWDIMPLPPIRLPDKTR